MVLTKKVARWVLVPLVLIGCARGYATAGKKSTGDYAPAYSPGSLAAEAVPADHALDEDRAEGELAGSPMGESSTLAIAAPPPPPAPPPAHAKSQGSAIDDPERKQPILIYTANFTLSVYEVEKSLDAVEGLARDAGGFMAKREDRSVTIRVPAQKFQDVVQAIEKVGDVLHRNVVSEDVTAEYRDLEVQLQNALAMRARFEKLLEKAVKVEEALSIERELGRITGDIERIKGRLKMLSDLARYSTITVVFSARSSEQVQQGPFVLPLPWLNNISLPRLLAL
jgi:hypothetical protein